MTLRRGLGLALLLVAAYVFWDAARAVLMLVERGSGFSDALLNPPLSAIKIAGGVIALLGGILAASGKPLGGAAGFIGGLIFGASPALFAALSLNPMDSLKDGIPALIMVGVSLALLFIKRPA